MTLTYQAKLHHAIKKFCLSNQDDPLPHLLRTHIWKKKFFFLIFSDDKHEMTIKNRHQPQNTQKGQYNSKQSRI